MQKKKIDISVIIVQYHAKEVLFTCIKSILLSRPKISYEIIVVDNDEIQTIKKDLLKLFSKIVYVKSPKNIGYGAGVNLGTKQAKGEYICIMNPDVILIDNTIDYLYEFAKKQKNAGIISSVMLDENKKIPE